MSNGKRRKAASRSSAAARGVEVAVVGNAVRAQVSARLTKKEISAALKGLGSGYAKFTDSVPHVTLSPQVPWVEGLGHLELINPRTVYPAGPNANFLAPPYGGDIDGEIGVWLLGLQVGASYFLQFRVSVGYDTAWKISSSQGYPFEIKTTGGPYHTLPVLLHEVDGTMELVRLEAPGYDWLFFDVDVSMLT